jgi:hypothetical protein
MSKALAAFQGSEQRNLLQEYEDAVLRGVDPSGASAQAHFRQQLQRALPALVSDVTKFLTTRPTTMATPGGSLMQMLPDNVAMTKDQVKLATTIIAKMLPSYVPENFDGTKVDQMPSVVKVSINQVGPDVDLAKAPGTPVTAGQAIARKTSLITISRAGVQIEAGTGRSVETGMSAAEVVTKIMSPPETAGVVIDGVSREVPNVSE